MDNNIQPPVEQNNNFEVLKAIWDFMYNNDNILACGGIALFILSIGIKIDKKKQLGGSDE